MLEGSGFLAALDEEFGDAELDLLDGISNEDLPFSDDPEETPALEEQLLGYRGDSEAPTLDTPAVEPPAGVALETPPTQALPADEFRSSSLANRIFGWNCFLREEQGLLIASTVITFFVLICVSALLPAQIQELFDALVRFAGLDRTLSNRLGIPL